MHDIIAPTPELPFYVEVGAKVHSRHHTATEALTAAQMAQAEHGSDDEVLTFIPYGPNGEIITEDHLFARQERYEAMTAHLM